MRTIGEIYEEIVSYKDTQSPLQDLAPTADTEQQLLSDLNSTSKVAIWRLFAYIIASAIQTLEGLFDMFKSEVDAKAAAAITGTPYWYQQQVFAFQYGDSLAFNPDTGKYEYPTIDEGARIVKRCSVTEEADGRVTFKVAKEQSGTLQALDAAELNALAAYVKKIRFAGTQFTLISGNGDLLRVSATVYYDGVLVQSDVQAAVEAAINDYVSNLPFNGLFLINKLIDAIQAVDGVNDVSVSSVETRQNTGDPWTQITRDYVPHFGYFRIDDTPGNTLSDTITYVAE